MNSLILRGVNPHGRFGCSHREMQRSWHLSAPALWNAVLTSGFFATRSDASQGGEARVLVL
jgi:hypothetical protein